MWRLREMKNLSRTLKAILLRVPRCVRFFCCVLHRFGRGTGSGAGGGPPPVKTGSACVYAPLALCLGALLYKVHECLKLCFTPRLGFGFYRQG